ncbi:hypothetical protein [Arthrobacter sp. MDT1-65]
MITQDDRPTDPDSAEARRSAAMDELNAREDYLRREEYRSDDELRAELKETIRQEKKTVDSFAGTEYYVVSESGKVHLPTCGVVRRYFDRDAIWEPYLDDLKWARDWHGDYRPPRMPNLYTRAAIESSEKYEMCELCSPTLDHTTKGAREAKDKHWQSVVVGRLAEQHFDKPLFTLEGDELGTLVRVASLRTKDGLDFQAEFTTGAVLTDPESKVRYKRFFPTKSQKAPSGQG